MDNQFKTELQKLIDDAAEKSVNRNMLELNEADGRVRHFKAGCEFLLPMVEKAIEQRNGFIDAGCFQTHRNIADNYLLNLLRGSSCT